MSTLLYYPDVYSVVVQMSTLLYCRSSLCFITDVHLVVLQMFILQMSTQCVIVNTLMICHKDLVETLDIEPIVAMMYARFCLTRQEKQHVEKKLKDFGM